MKREGPFRIQAENRWNDYSLSEWLRTCDDRQQTVTGVIRSFGVVWQLVSTGHGCDMAAGACDSTSILEAALHTTPQGSPQGMSIFGESATSSVKHLDGSRMQRNSKLLIVNTDKGEII